MIMQNLIVRADPEFPTIFWHRYDGTAPKPAVEEGVHLWLVQLDHGVGTAWRVLSAEEKMRAHLFATRELRERFIVARGALRCIVGACTGCAPEVLRFSCNKAGKPFLPGRVRFNLSHSGGWALVGVVRGALTAGADIEADIGVDIELLQPVPDAVALARKWFSSAEAAWIEKKPFPRFLRCWTLREAFLKALGVGLQVPLDSFAVSVSEGIKEFPFVTGHAAARHTRLAEGVIPGQAVMAVAICPMSVSFF